MNAETVKYWAQMWRIERQDGEIIALTDHDFDIEFEGEVYAAKSALTSSEVQAAIGLEAENSECLGGVDGDMIRLEDLKAGRFMDAHIRHFLFDFDNHRIEHEIFSGSISKLYFGETHFRAELTSDLDRLDYVFGRKFSKTCGVKFCSKECGLNSSNYCLRSEITKIQGSRLEIEAQDFAFPLDNGIIEFEGVNSNIAKAAIREFSDQGDIWIFELWRAPEFDPKIGDGIKINAGCDKTIEQCQETFANALNFRGFPHLPGEEILSRKAGENG